ncbi:hypothetical protein AB0L41_03890 [Amycolatopsis mediterranei]|uniref:hypothetical protein n=1 Tax=Amycolatopsis mediterranei TaxID=33910 RepID=UPI0034483423
MGTEAGYFDAWLPGGFPPSGPLKGWAAEHAAAHLPGFDHAPGYRVAALARAP